MVVNVIDKNQFFSTLIKKFEHKSDEKKIFFDLCPLMATNWNLLIERLEQTAFELFNRIDFIIGVESKGLLIASTLAFKLNVPFLALRKKGKLPGDLTSLKLKNDQIYEFQNHYIEDGHNILIVDDIFHDKSVLETFMDCLVSIHKVHIKCLVILKTTGTNDIRINCLINY